jgi:hypothetical protein
MKRAREDEYRNSFPEEKAEVRTTALMMWSRTLMPEVLMTMTKGD